MNPDLAEIEERRLAMGVSKMALERAAGLSSQHYQALVAGRHAVTAAALARLRIGLARLKRAEHRDIDPASYAPHCCWRVAAALVADALGLPAGEVLDASPRQRATRSPRWLRLAEARRLALYLVNTAMGFSQAEAARAAGMSKQGVHDACREIEERRNEAAFDALCDRLTMAITGDWR